MCKSKRPPLVALNEMPATLPCDCGCETPVPIPGNCPAIEGGYKRGMIFANRTHLLRFRRNGYNAVSLPKGR